MSFNLINSAKAAWQSVSSLFSSDSPANPTKTCPIGPAGEHWVKAAESVFPGQQSYQNCGVQSARQIVEQATGQCLNETELEFLDKAISSCGAEKAANHPTDSGGTGAATRQCILKQYGVASSVQDASVDKVDAALVSGQGVIISADVEVLWDKQGYPGQAGRHAVVVTHGKYDTTGRMVGVYVNDTGINKRYFLTNDELEDVLESGSGQMNVTDKRVWPTD